MQEKDIILIKDNIISLARQELVPRFAQVTHEHKADGSIVTEADIVMQTAVIDFLQQHWPDIPVLGEEMSTATQQALIDGDGHYWCLDPLDGTSNFAAGLPYFCTSLALVNHGRCQFALIYDPIRDECFTATDAGPATLNAERLNLDIAAWPLNQAIAFIDLKRLPSHLAMQLVSRPPFASQRNFGSGALDWAWLAAGRFHYYLHGGQKLWDYTAGELILRQAGGVATTFSKEPVTCHQLTPRSICASINATAQATWLGYVQSILDQ
ncbi:MAG: inositol monophosphatase [Gammaproteobacteria bacterium]|nr:inositol monophosphatase [Gammaproteobacteria bacterium]MDH5731939.1 inositol monophosphatase [Gammaproteobacteria bacterium]